MGILVGGVWEGECIGAGGEVVGGVKWAGGRVVKWSSGSVVEGIGVGGEPRGLRTGGSVREIDRLKPTPNPSLWEGL
jgi:hypothetical protein